MKLSFLVTIALLFCELLGFSSVGLAMANDRIFLLFPVIIGAIALFWRWKDKWLFSSMAATMAIFLFSAFHAASVTAVVSRGLIILHAFLWLAREQSRYRYWRLGLCFLEIILGAVLLPEAHMMALIFLFVFASSAMLSFSFIAKTFQDESPQNLEAPLRPVFLGAAAGLGLCIFLIGLLLFPFLPRANMAGISARFTEVGYAEVVSFRDSTKAWSKGNERILLWLFLPEGKTEIPKLIRGKVLEVFDGHEWFPAAKQIVGREVGGDRAPAPRWEILREPMQTDVLPVPYGADQVAIENIFALRQKSGEWVSTSRRNKRLRYSFTMTNAMHSDDLPREVHLRLPSMDRFPRLNALGGRWKNETGTKNEKINKVVAFFKSGQFIPSQEEVASSLDEGTHPVERFLFETKKGHCELFATAAAMLLRKMGIPSRTIVGFRVPPERAGTMIPVHNSDAHAWVEVWAEGRGWIPIDVMPFLLAPSTTWNFFQETYDWVNAYWSRYILGYEFDSTPLKKLWAFVLTLLPQILFCLAFMGVIASLFSFRKKIFQRPEPRSKVAKIFQRLPKQKKNFIIEKKYQNLRFGRAVPDAENVKQFEREVEALIVAPESELAN